jgi:hypothetical protein
MNEKYNKTKKTYYKKDYESNNGMLVSIWGPSAWHFMHTMSFNYPVHPTNADKKHYRDYMLNLVNILPCGKCRKNLKENFKKLPLKKINMRNRESFSRYVYDLHELVNHMLGKESGLSYLQIKERYEHFRARCALSNDLINDRDLSEKNDVVFISKMRNGVKGEILPIMKSYTRKLDTRKQNQKIENGCTEPLIGEKSKCILKIVPEKTKCKTFSMDSKCVKHRII